eukprot:CAMPEP_0194530272 /NCGR_PEP_ID=MMETSP0253-20130528/67179_1 /TAXON_ID=2966 /ORGANISM="Noctiluca scintillans" /LENGTH=86 /DNA_ID=CAMNT_0039375489 /DNA_START=303 /DNA_END=563 /DNA_ORIENTATION=+
MPVHRNCEDGSKTRPGSHDDERRTPDVKKRQCCPECSIPNCAAQQHRTEGARLRVSTGHTACGAFPWVMLRVDSHVNSRLWTENDV